MERRHKKIIKKGGSVSQDEKFKSDTLYSCRLCKETFTKKQMLGAHMSSRHKGESKAYQHKLKVMNARTDERALLDNAKRLFYVMNPGADHRKARSTLNQLRKKIIE